MECDAFFCKGLGSSMDEKSTGHRTASFKDNPKHQNTLKQKDVNALLSGIGQNAGMCFGNAPNVLAAGVGKASCDPNPCCWCVASRAQLASANALTQRPFPIFCGHAPLNLLSVPSEGVIF